MSSLIGATRYCGPGFNKISVFCEYSVYYYASYVRKGQSIAARGVRFFQVYLYILAAVVFARAPTRSVLFFEFTMARRLCVLVLEDGTEFAGYSFGSQRLPVDGEVGRCNNNLFFLYINESRRSSIRITCNVC